MAVSRTTRKLIEKGDFDGLEDEWLTRLTEKPDDLEYFSGAAKALAGSGEEERSRQLLEILDEQLVGERTWELRIRLLQLVGHLLFDEETLHGEILKSLRAVYSDSDVLEPLMERLGLYRAIADIPKTWKKAQQLRTLMSFDRGAVVWMEGKGAGEITDVNIELEKLRVDLAGKPAISVGFGAAAKVLEPLPERHFLHQKVRQPSVLTTLATEDPSAALGLLLESVGKPLSAGEIKDAFAGLIKEGSWTSWWGRARNHPQVTTSGKGSRQTYGWAATSGEASEKATRLFESGTLSEKLKIYRREAKRRSDVAAAMADALTLLGEDAIDSNPGDAFTIASTLESISGSVPETLNRTRLLGEASDPIGLIAGLADKTLRRCDLRPATGATPYDYRAYFADYPQDDASDYGHPPTPECL